MADRPVFPHLARTPLRECDSVAAAALEHLGKAYRITRELRPGLIDCSTVVSQAHWIGAGIITPFIAESQRLASNAKIVDREEVLPGDAIFSYPDRASSPGGRHNHVALCLGKAEDGNSWAIESREETGAVLIELASVAFAGGIRRFCINPLQQFPPGFWSELVMRVPKLGRLGARLTADYAMRTRHSGIDIYVDGGWTVTSPLTGSIVDVAWVYGRSFAGIWSPEKRLYSLVGPVERTSSLRVGRDILEGEVLGGTSRGSAPGGCNAIPGIARLPRVHWELWGPPEFGVSPLRDLRCDSFPKRIRKESYLIPHNAVYALKCGTVAACVTKG